MTLNFSVDRDSLVEAVWDEITEGVTLTDRSGTILAVNRAFSAITGYEASEAVGRNPRILKSQHHDDHFYREMWRSIKDEGRWEGEIWNRRKDGEIYPEWLSIKRLSGSDGSVYYMAVFSDLSRMKSMKEGKSFHGAKDALTGLPDRFVLMERLSASLARGERQGESVGLIVLNLNRFKDVNDGFGYLVGDKVLRHIGDRFRSIVRDHEIVARVGSDEFAFVIPQNGKSDRIRTVLRSIGEVFQRPISISDAELNISVSVGVSVFPDDAASGDEMIRNAGLAMHRVKREALLGGYALYNDEMDRDARRRAALEQEMRLAMDRGEFFLQYQPQVLMGGSEIVGVEALVRWRKPDGEVVSPGEFIPLAEETGIMIPLGRWILEEACRQGVLWERAGFYLKMSVNVSPVQIYGDDLYETVASVLKETGFPAERLTLEITENTLKDNGGYLLDIFDRIKELGVKVAIDDFGTGYASFDFIRNFPFYGIKIDRSFVLDLERSPRSAAVANSVIAMARNMARAVVVEGVETESQLFHIGGEKTDLIIQGFVYSRPLNPEKLPDFVESLRPPVS